MVLDPKFILKVALTLLFAAGLSCALTPLVKVVDTGTLVWEGSCGSGSVACAVAESEGISDGLFEQDYLQPAGVIRASVVRKNGAVSAASIGGPVTLGAPLEITLD